MSSSEESDSDDSNKWASSSIKSDENSPCPSEVYIKTEFKDCDSEEEEEKDPLADTETTESTNNFELKYDKDLIPRKSHRRYMRTYDIFMQWHEQSKLENFSQDVLLAYFCEKLKTTKPSSLWTIYSMLRSTLQLKNEVDIGEYKELVFFLRKQMAGFQGKKSKKFSIEEIRDFLARAPDSTYLLAKVIAVFGVVGTCKYNECTKITLEDIKRRGDTYTVDVPTRITSFPRSFSVIGEMASVIDKYIALRPANCSTNLFFLGYDKGVCTMRSVAFSKFRSTPKTIAKFLNLDEPEQYSRSSFQQTSSSPVPEEFSSDIIRHKRRADDCEDEIIANKFMETKAKYVVASGEKELSDLCNVEIQLPKDCSSITLTNCVNCNIVVENRRTKLT